MCQNCFSRLMRFKVRKNIIVCQKCGTQHPAADFQATGDQA